MSKNLQINWIIRALDLTPEGVNSAMNNMDKLAKHQMKLDKDRILNRQAVLQDIALGKAAKAEEEFQKKQNNLYLARHSQLLGREAVMERAHQLRKLKGDERGLRSYLQMQRGLLSEEQSKDFDSKNWKGKAANLAKQLAIQGRINRGEIMLGNAIAANTKRREIELRTRQKQAAAAEKAAQKQAAAMEKAAQKQAAVAQRQAAAAQRQAAAMEKAAQRQAAAAQRQARIETERRAMGAVAIGAGSGIALRRGGRGVGYAFGQTMDLEQLGIAMEAQFGDKEGKMVMADMKKYSIETMFKLKDTIQLLLDVKKGAENIGLKNTEDMIAFTKKIGEPLLSFAVNEEKRSEAGYQLGQIFMAGTANERQDIKVIARTGVPIYAALTKMTGKNIKELKDIYGAELPATLIAKAMLFLAESKENMEAMAKYEKSFTIAWQGSTEQFQYTSAAFGDKVAEALKIPSMLRLAMKAMEGIEKSLEKGGGGFAVYLLSIAGISTGLLAMKGTIMGIAYAMQFVTGTTIVANGTLLTFTKLLGAVIPRFLILSGITSGIYLVLTKWDSVFESINKQGLIGVLDHMDKLVSTLAVLGVGFATGGFTGLLLAAAGIGAVGIYKYLQYQGDVEAAQLGSFSKTYASGQLLTPNMTPWQQSSSFNENIAAQKMFPRTEAAMTPIQPQVNVGLQTIVNAATGEAKTTVKRNPSNIYNSWDKTYRFDGY